MAMAEISTLRDHKQLLSRFGICLAVVTLVLGMLLWNQKSWIAEQHSYVEAGIVALDVRNSIYKISLIRGDLYTPEMDRVTQRGQSEILRLKALLATVDNFASLRDTDPRKALYRYYHSQEGRLGDRIAEFLRAAEAINAEPHLPFVSEITTTLTTLAGQDFLESEVLTQRLSSVQLGIFASILVLFIVLSIFIILPARSLLVAQRKAQERAMQEMQEKNRKLVASREELSAQKTFLESVLTHSSVPLIHFDCNGRLLHLSRVIRELLPGTWDASGWDSELSMKLLESRELSNPLLVKTWLSSISEGKSIHNQMVLLPAADSNEDIHLLVNGHPVSNPTGSVESGVLYFLDITERIRFEENLREAMRGTEAASRANRSSSPILVMKSAHP